MRALHGLLFGLALSSLTLHASGRGRKKAKSHGGAHKQPARGSGPYIPLDWEALEQIPTVQPGGEVPDAADGSEGRRLLGMIGMPNDFMTRIWQRRVALAQRVDPRLTQLMGGFEDLEKLIASNKLSLGVDAKFALGGKVAQMSGTLDLARAQDGYKRGATLVINRLEKFWPPCTALATQMEKAVQIFTSLNMYFTPPGSRGFDPHFDYEDVFIVQVQGVKRWRVWEPDPVVGQEPLALNDERSRKSQAKTAVPTTAPRATILNPGDVLYIPRGWSHVAEAEGSSPSLHMTITLHVQDFTWESLLRFFVLTGDALSTVEDAGFELGHSGAVDVHSGGGSPAASYADPALKKALRAPSGCQTRSTVVGVPSKSASHEMVLVVALHTAAVASPSLREVHAPGWSNNGAETSTTVLDMVGLWEKLLIPTGLEATLDCADVSDTLDETKESRFCVDVDVNWLAGCISIHSEQLLRTAVAGTDLGELKSWVATQYARGFVDAVS